MSEGDIVARNYVEQLLQNSQQAEITSTLIECWGVLTSIIWDTNKSDTITSQYREYIEKVIIPWVPDDTTSIDAKGLEFYTQFLSDYVAMLHLEKDYNRASFYLRLMLSWYDKVPEAQKSMNYISTLNDYCVVLIRDLHQYKEALPYIERDIKLIGDSIGMNTAEYAIALYNKSVCLAAINKHKDGIELAKIALEIYRGTTNPDSQLINQIENDIKGSEILITGTNSISEQDINVTSSDKEELSWSDCLSLIVSGRSTEAIPSLLKMKLSKEREAVLDTLSYISISSTLSTAYLEAGKINEAQHEIEETMKKININSLPPQYSSAFNSQYSIINCHLKRYSEAIQYAKKALALYSEIHDFGIEYIKVLSNISLCYMGLGDFTLAKWFNDEAIELFTENVDSNIYENTSAVNLLSNKAMIYQSIGDYSGAESVLKSIINYPGNKERNFESYLLASNNLAVIYMKQNKWAEAIPLIKNIQSSSNEKNYLVFQNLALAYLNTDQKKLAVSILQDFNKTATENCTEIISHFTESERDNYWSTIAKELLMVNNLIAYSSIDDKAVSMAYNITLFCRNLYLDNNSYIDEYIMNDGSPSLKSKYQEFKNYRGTLFRKSTSSSETHDSLNHLNELEREIIASIPNLAEELRDSAGNWEAVRDALSDDEVAIEFTYVPIMQTYPEMEEHYGAFVLKKDFSAPKLVLLADVDSVEDIIYNTDPDELFINNLYNTNNATRLYSLLWEKLIQFLEPNCTVYYSPIGFLSNINFDIIEDDYGIKCFDRYNMVRVSSTKNISNYKNHLNVDFLSASLYGNITYDESTSEMVIESAKYQAFSGVDVANNLASRSINDRGRWGLLPYTKNEIDSISSTLSIGNVIVKKWEGREGSEEAFKSYDGKSPDIIHLATHGFVIDTYKKAEGNKYVNDTTPFSQREGYMMWCGLMMAGSNNAWTGNFNLENVEDGVLTADEISRLDLSNTELVVLSACETARGKVDPVEGVLGLQRAFKKAGAQTVVMSLWKVPDESTAILMTLFYRGLMAGIERHQALKEAMNYVKTLYPDPYYWAGFIMLD